MVSVTNPLMDSEIWGANLAGKCGGDKAVPLRLPDADNASYQDVESNLYPGGSHPTMQKSGAGFSNLVGARGLLATSWLALRAVAGATFSRFARVELPPEVLILMGYKCKSLLVEQAFRIWSVIEDSNLRPLRPERSALPGCANHRMRGASYCADTPSSIP